MFAVMEKTPRQAVTGPVPATEDRPKTACGHSSPAPHPHPLPDVPGRGSCFSAATEFSEARRNGAQLVGPWRTLVEQSAQASVDLHPELVLDSGTGGRHPAHGVILHPRGDLSGVGSLAVLIEKTVRLPWLPGCSWRSSLRGLRLIGNRSLGVDDDATARALVQRCAGLLESPRSRHACVLLEDVEVDSPLWRAAQQTRQARVVVLAQPQTRWTLRFPSDAAAYWGRFSAKTRYNFRRLQRLLPHTWCVVDQPSQVAAFLAEAAVVSQQSWQGKRLGVRVRSDQEQLRHFTQLAELGALRCYLLRSEGVPWLLPSAPNGTAGTTWKKSATTPGSPSPRREPSCCCGCWKTCWNVSAQACWTSALAMATTSGCLAATSPPAGRCCW